MYINTELCIKWRLTIESSSRQWPNYDCVHPLLRALRSEGEDLSRYGILEYEIVSSKRSRFLRSQHIKFSFSNLNRVCINFHLSSSASLGVPNGGEGNLLCHGSRHKDVLHRLSGRYRQIAIKDTMSWYMNKKGDIDV
ncbi:hypothetical protein NQ317_012375 [Molorchus minor]|uniref:Uncharacterized protein n=1 Tax=Molorchus minor TaxID=1323400 RepID=A0ABQ9JP76_9CUCU|nr:hypothetical protein NQ317_012375 [Molorchus minor]